LRNSNEPLFDTNYELEITELLSKEEYDAQKVRVDEIGDKLKVMFSINDLDKAKKCYSDFVGNPFIHY
jgi:hypothetical protein